MMTLDRIGWKSESRPDIAAELARAASLKRNAALDLYNAQQEARRARIAQRNRFNAFLAIAALSVALMFFMGLAIQEHNAMSETQQETVARIFN
jgi:hypothetical protein